MKSVKAINLIKEEEEAEMWVFVLLLVLVVPQREIRHESAGI